MVYQGHISEISYIILTIMPWKERPEPWKCVCLVSLPLLRAWQREVLITLCPYDMSQSLERKVYTKDSLNKPIWISQNVIKHHQESVYRIRFVHKLHNLSWKKWNYAETLLILISQHRMQIYFSPFIEYKYNANSS